MLGTIFFVHSSKGWMFSNEGGGWEFPAYWAAALLVQAMLDNGAFTMSALPSASGGSSATFAVR